MASPNVRSYGEKERGRELYAADCGHLLAALASCTLLKSKAYITCAKCAKCDGNLVVARRKYVYYALQKYVVG
jgi:hypothetical protein